MFLKILGWIISICAALLGIVFVAAAIAKPWAIGLALVSFALSATTNPLLIPRLKFLDTRRKIGFTYLILTVLGAIFVAAYPKASVSSEVSVQGSEPSEDADSRTFKDCDKCAEMIRIPGGTFEMGAAHGEVGLTGEGKSVPANPNEYPQHKVQIQPFAAGRFEITFDDWDYCVVSGGCQSNKEPDDNGLGRGRNPVIHVSWNDAQEYVAWISKKTGHKYRLLSEAEWEYAARAGTKTPYFWGSDFNAAREYCVCSSDDGQLKAVGTLKPNPFGLYDTSGNVAELVQDVGHLYSGAPTDGSAWMSETNARRMAEDHSPTAIVRGGSVESSPLGLRSASREFINRSNRIGTIGFRIARELP